MVTFDPSLVILSATIAIVGAFTACVMTSGIMSLPNTEGRTRMVMAAFALGSSIWATHFVSALAIDAQLNWQRNPGLIAVSAAIALLGTGFAMFLIRSGDAKDPARVPVAIAILGLTIAATNYLGLGAVAGRGLRLSWFLTLIGIAISLQTAGILIWFLFRQRGVIITLLGTVGVGLAIAATPYVAVASAQDLAQTLASIHAPQNSVAERYLAWSASIMMYLICSICLCVYVIMQFQEEAE